MRRRYLLVVCAGCCLLPGTRPLPAQTPGEFGGVLNDTERLFETLARDKNHIILGRTGKLRPELEDFADDQGLDPEKINRAAFAQFNLHLTAKLLRLGYEKNPSPGMLALTD